MPRKVSGFAAAMSSPETCRKWLIIFAAIVVLLLFLLNMTSFMLVVVSAVLALPAAFLWKYRAARVIMRGFLCLWLAAVPVLLIVVALMGFFAVDYFAQLCIITLALPAISLASRAARRFDVILLRFAAAINAIGAALIIAYIFSYGAWVEMVLFGAANLCFLVLAVMSFPPDLTPLRKKMDAARAKYQK